MVHAHPPLSTGFAVAGIPLDRAVLAEVVTTLGSIPIAEYGTPSTRELADAVAPYVRSHDGLLLANHGALALGAGSVRRVLQDGDDRALRAHQPGGAPARPRAPALARGSGRGCRICAGTYGIASPAPICPDPPTGEPWPIPSARWSWRPTRRASGSCRTRASRSGDGRISVGTDGEIRLTYAQLTELIDEAVRQLAQANGVRQACGRRTRLVKLRSVAVLEDQWARRWEWSRRRGWSR